MTLRLLAKPLVVLALLVASLLSPIVVTLWSRTVFDFLGIGASWSVTGLPLIFLLIVFASEPLKLPWRDSWKPLLPAGLLLLHLMGLLERYLLCRKAGLPLTQSLTVAHDGRFAISSPTAAQEGQAVLGWLAGWVGQEQTPGSLFVPLFPGWLLALHAVLLSVVLVVALLALHHEQKSMPVEWVVSLTWSVYALLWSALSGGPFSPPALVALPLCLGMLLGERASRVGWAISLVALCASLWMAGSAWSSLLLQALGGLLVLLSPLFLERWRHSRGRVWLLAAVTSWSVVLVLPWLQLRVAPWLAKPPHTQGLIHYSQRTLLPGGLFFILGPQGLKDPAGGELSIVDTLRGQNLAVYRAKLNVKKGIPELAKLYDLDLATHPIIWKVTPAYVRITGRFPKPFPKLTSEMVLGYRLEEKGELSTLHMTLQGNGGLATAIDALPKGTMVLGDIVWTETFPTDFRGWRTGAGFAKRLLPAGKAPAQTGKKPKTPAGKGKSKAPKPQGKPAR